MGGALLGNLGSHQDDRRTDLIHAFLSFERRCRAQFVRPICARPHFRLLKFAPQRHFVVHARQRVMGEKWENDTNCHPSPPHPYGEKRPWRQYCMVDSYPGFYSISMHSVHCNTFQYISYFLYTVHVLIRARWAASLKVEPTLHCVTGSLTI